MRRGVRLGIDVGSVRIGVARSDPSGFLATPVETVKRGRGDLNQIAAIAAEHEAIEIVVGLPTSLSGRESHAAAAARDFARSLAARLAPTPIRLFDERLTTVTAAQGLRSSGVKGRQQRAVIDQAAAVVLLQAALDAERATGLPPGRPLDEKPARSKPAAGKPAPGSSASAGPSSGEPAAGSSTSGGSATGSSASAGPVSGEPAAGEPEDGSGAAAGGEEQ